MPCTSLPEPALPTLGGGITLAPSLPGYTLEAKLCCKVLPYVPKIPPIPLPPGAIQAMAPLLAAARAAIKTFMDALPVACPRE